MRRHRRSNPRWWSEKPWWPDQVVNAKDTAAVLAVVSEARAEATLAGWLPLATGQPVPLLGEVVVPDDDALRDD